MSAIRTLLVAASLALTAVAIQAQEIRTEQVRFAAGATGTSISDEVTGRESVSYLVGAQAGQVMSVVLSSDSTAVYFNLYAPGRGPGDEALAIGELQPEINRWEGVLPASGTYTVSVFLVRSAARRGEAARYTLDIAIPPDGSWAEPVEGDYADGLEGGPDFWEVRSSGMLNLRSQPSTGAAVVFRAEPGLILRNLGCRMNEGRRWCQVVTMGDSGIEGWAAGDFLGESGYVEEGSATQLPDMIPTGNPDGEDAVDPVTGFAATGIIDCFAGPGAERLGCDFGVWREGNGSGTVQITMPDGTVRAVRYEGGRPVGFDRSEADGDMAFEATRQDDNYFIYIGDQSVLIPDAVIFGG
ncbi:SH3 domain-containing protein [Rubellimicrobium roseum]|uniref:SH3 domain-containing protein n=1 Tax=Rubellimicrobium roseum TaxID=687525 RepID=A0A5C4N8V3_9RHOB|nr:SH3 domain-containing protein [Rubellimicrobium roseum]TNC65375.1 SH3 domain-containing protein [Rubellimicrobium roseum]